MDANSEPFRAASPSLDRSSALGVPENAALAAQRPPREAQDHIYLAEGEDAWRSYDVRSRRPQRWRLSYPGFSAYRKLARLRRARFLVEKALAMLNG